MAHGKLYLLIRLQAKIRKVEVETKEEIAFNNNLKEDNRNLYLKVENLKQKDNKIKMLYFENLKYNEQMQDLISKGIITYESEERIQL